MVKRYEDDEAIAQAKKDAGRKSWEGHDAPTVNMSAAEAEALPELTLDDAMSWSGEGSHLNRWPGKFPESKPEALGSRGDAVDLGTSTVTPPPGMTAEQRKRWEVSARGRTAGGDYGTGFKWTDEDTQRVKQIGDVAAEIAIAPYGLYKDLTEIQKLLAAGSVGAAVGVGAMAAAGPIGKGLKHAGKVIRGVLQSSDAKQAQHLDDWLAGRRGPEGLDPEVVQAAEILRDPKRVTQPVGTPAQVKAEAGLDRARAQQPGSEFKPDFGNVERRIRTQQNYRTRNFGDADLNSLSMDEIDARLEHIRSTGAQLQVQRDEIDSLLAARERFYAPIPHHGPVRKEAQEQQIFYEGATLGRGPIRPLASGTKTPPERHHGRRRQYRAPPTDKTFTSRYYVDEEVAARDTARRAAAGERPEDVFSDVKREGALTPERIEAANTPPLTGHARARARVGELEEEILRLRRKWAGPSATTLDAEALYQAEGELRGILNAYGDLLD